MKFSKITRFVYIFMWTGIFILSSYIIVKGEHGSLVAMAGEGMLKRGSKFFAYYSSEQERPLKGISWLFNGWKNGSYLYRMEAEEAFVFEEDEDTQKLILEYEEGNILPQIPFIHGESYYEETTEEAFVEAENKNKKLIE